MLKYIKLGFPATILAAIAITLYWLLPLSDPDYFWHLKAGELIFSSRSILSTDPFSFTMHGAEWVLHEWLFQVLLYISSNIFGDHGIRALIISAIAGMLYFTHRAAQTGEQNRIISSILMLWLLLTLIPFMTPRPQLASYFLFSYYLYAIHLTLVTKQTKHLLPLPFLMVLWVNLHGGYIIGIILLLLVTVSKWISEKSELAHNKTGPLARYLAIATVATLLASSINPDFIYHWKYPFYVLSMDATAQISEWHSPNFRTPYARSFLALIMLYVFFLAYSKTRPSIEKFVIPLFFIAAALLSTRNIPFALISIVVFFPKLNIIDTDKFRCITHPFKIIKERYIRLTSSSQDIGQKEYILNWLILTLIAVIIPLSSSPPSHTMYPDKAVNYFIENKLKGNILSEYINGGYLIHRLYPSSRVFIDGRADMYGDKIVSEHSRIMHGAADWEKLFNSYKIDYIICRNNTPIRQLLLQLEDFELLYKDKTHSIIKSLRR